MRVALLTNFIPPYRVPLFQELRRHVSTLRIFVSTRMAGDRQWQPDWGDLDVVVQRTLTFRRVWKTERFQYPYEMHIPYDTIPLLRRFQPDVILSGELSARSVQAAVYGSFTRTPVCIWATLADHLEDSRGRLRAEVRRVLLRHVAKVIVNGRSGAAYARRMGVEEARIAIIPQTTELSAFSAVPLERDSGNQRTLLVVGALTELKAVDLLLRAVASLTMALRLVVVGDGPQRSELQQLAIQLGVHVEWVGHVDYQRLPEFYQRAGLFVFPTLGDEWGLVVNEALATGLPVLGSEYSQAVQDLIVDGQNGWRFRPDSITDVADALRRALGTSDAELSRMRACARATVAELRPADIAARFAGVIQELHEA